ncbi:response regulator [soil metagenome]
MRLLLIEDDVMVGEAVCEGLDRAGYSIDWVQDGRAAELALDNGVYQLAILDLTLPKQDGMTLLRLLRRRDSQLPVLITSARDGVADRICGLDAGADDYLLKPFDLDELLARVRALLRRFAGSASPVYSSAGLVLDPMRRSVTLNGDAVALSAREFAVLEKLMLRPGSVVSRQQLEESVYAWSAEVSSNAIEVHLHNLRRKLGSNMILNVRGVGYRVAG